MFVYLKAADSTLPACTTSEQYKEYLGQFSEIVKLSENSISTRTGCLPNCARSEFRARVASSWHTVAPNDTVSGKKVITKIFNHPSGRYRERTYYYTYEWTSFVADVGGYLGLLLGHSVLSFYDIAKGYYSSFRR